MFAIDYDTAPFDPDGPTQADLSVLPEGLATMAPGPDLAALLAGIDVDELSGYDQVIVLEAQHRMASHYQAATYRTIAAVADTMQAETPSGWGDAYQLAAAEIASALHLTRRASETELGTAWELTHRVPQLLWAMDQGTLDRRRTLAVLHNTSHLQDEHLSAVVDAVMDEAPELTAGQIRARVRKLAFTTDPESAQRRYDQAVAERRLELRAEAEGTATLVGYDLPPAQAQAAVNHLNTIARHLKNQGDSRTLDQIRADVLCDLLSGRHLGYAKGQGTVDINVDLKTLAELAEHPGDLGGYGPVVADIARQVTGQQRRSLWRWFVTDPNTGELVAHGATKRRPGAATKRRVQFRNRRCVYPGCRVPATQSDLDHTIAWSRGGATDPHNLGPLCRHHHGLRHLGWKYKIDADGTVHWTSPFGHHYTVRPDKDAERAPPDH